MATERIKTRIQMKTDTPENWATKIDFIPMRGEIIIYLGEEEGAIPSIKVGDGETLVEDLPFIASSSSSDGNFVNQEDFNELNEAFINLNSSVKEFAKKELANLEEAEDTDIGGHAADAAAIRNKINSINTLATNNQTNLTTLTERLENDEVENAFKFLNQGDLAEITNTVSTLIGEDSPTEGETQKSIRTIAREELAVQLIDGAENGAEDNFNTLKQLADWLEQHPEDAAAMNSEILEIKRNLNYSGENLNTAPDTVNSRIDSLATNLQTYIDSRTIDCGTWD